MSQPIENSGDTIISSYNSHKFFVKFADHNKTVIGGNFTKGPDNEEVTVVYDESKNRLDVKHEVKVDELSSNIRSVTSKCSKYQGSKFSKCVADGIFDDITRLDDTKSRLTKYRDVMSNRLRNYTCADPNMETTAPTHTKEVTVQGKTYNVNYMLDLKSAKIWVVEDFITPEECEVFEKHGRPLLHRATG